MSQVTLYLDDETEAALSRAAQAANTSKSKWVAKLIRTNAGDEWPQSVVEMAGSWGDFPSAEELRDSPAADAQRVEW